MEENQLRLKHEGVLKKFKLWVQVDRANLNEEMARNSSRMFNVNLLKADAEYRKDKAEDRIKVLEAQVDRLVRKTAKRKLTEQQIKQRLARDPTIMKARDDYFEAKWVYNMCWAAANSVSQKGEQLTNLGHILRKEMEHGTKTRVINSNVERLKKGRV